MDPRAKKYSNIKYGLAIIDVFYLFLLLFIFQASGLSKALAGRLSALLPDNYFVIPAYLLVVFVAYYILNFPLNYYQSFVLEHKFSLSNQNLKSWTKDQLKSGAISYFIAVILILAFYYILKRYLYNWWLVISLFWIFFSLGLARLTPIVIIPLFFKYKRLTDEALRQRILDLADKMKVKILDCFEIDFSSKTIKANAAFVGLGRTKRVILADTLKDKYSYDEIGVILAHEFAHYKLRHLLKLMLVSSAATMLTFYAIFLTSGRALALFGLSSLWDIASLPLVAMYFIVFGIITQPLENYISRKAEKNADIMALRVTGLKDAFISMMEKLARQNLADTNPHPVIKFFFFNHPTVDERISLAKSFNPQS